MVRVFVGAVAVLFSACVSPSGASGYLFPERFFATQVVHIKTQSDSRVFVASLVREGHRFVLVMLDPVLQRPLLRLVRDSQGVHVRKFQELGLKESEVEWLMQEIVYMYEAARFSPVGADLAGAHGGVNYLLQEWQGPQSCRWPRVIHWTVQHGEGIAVKIENQEWACEKAPESPTH